MRISAVVLHLHTSMNDNTAVRWTRKPGISMSSQHGRLNASHLLGAAAMPIAAGTPALAEHDVATRTQVDHG